MYMYMCTYTYMYMYILTHMLGCGCAPAGVCAARACADDIQLSISTHVSAMARACVTVCTCESPMAHARVNVCITGGVRQAQEEALERAIASGDEGAVVVKRMREHAANAAIQREGCRALWSLAAESAENRVQIGRMGASRPSSRRCRGMRRTRGCRSGRAGR